MSTYYQQDVDTLHEALEYCASYQGIRPSVVFRGQADHRWALTANGFRRKMDLPFDKTEQFVAWWSDQPDTPRLTPEQLWQVAQEYGMSTDLLDFSASASVAAFFALGEPDPARPHVLPHRAALFLIDPLDFDRIHELASDISTARVIPERMKTLLARYTQIWWPNRIADLHRLEAQQGCFVRDPNGTLEKVTDGRFSLLPLIYEDAFGHPPLLQKIVFSPRPDDVLLLANHEVTKAALFPLPNQLESLVLRFNEENEYTLYL